MIEGALFVGGEIAVIPIFVSGGAALLPALIAGAVSFCALLLKPKAIFRACVRRPYVPIAIALIGVGGVFGGKVLNAHGSAGSGRDLQSTAGGTGGASISVDWRKKALQIMKDKKKAGRSTSSAVSTAETKALAEAGAVMLGRDASRCGYDGGGAPLALEISSRYIDPIDKETAMMLASPAVSGKWIYGATCVLDPPDNYGVAYCLDAKTMKARWAVDVLTDPASGKEIELKGFFSSPAVSADGQYVVFGQGLHPDNDCNLICLDTKTGKLKWRISTSLHIESSPAIDGDMVVVGCGAIEDPRDHAKVLGHKGYVLAVQLSTGKELWQYDVADPESSPALSDGIAYIGSGFNGKGIVALRTDTDDVLKEKGLARLLWKYEAPYPMTGAITLSDDLVLAGGGNGDFVFSNPDPAGVVIALDRKDGSLKWKVDIGDSVLGFVATKGGTAVFTSRTGEVIALSTKDGSILWRQAISSGAPALAGPAFTGRYIYATSKDGYLAVLDAQQNGKILEKHYINDEAHPGEQGLTLSSPSVVGGRVYIGSETGGLVCFEGREVGQ